MKHQCGDIVTVRSWKSMENEFGASAFNDSGSPLYYSIIKSDFCGKTIRLNSPRRRGGVYVYNGFLLFDWMFEWK